MASAIDGLCRHLLLSNFLRSRCQSIHKKDSRRCPQSLDLFFAIVALKRTSGKTSKKILLPIFSKLADPGEKTS